MDIGRRKQKGFQCPKILGRMIERDRILGYISFIPYGRR
jgi:hypothetical protein